jgi:hypothetical protein
MKPPAELIILLWRLFVFISRKETWGFLFFNFKSSAGLLNSFFYLPSEQANISQKGGRSR